MDDSNKQEFKETFDAVSEYYQQKAKLTPIALRMYFSGLSEYSMGQVQNAIELHMRDSSGGQFYPKVSDLVSQIEGGPITADMVISAAKLAKTPFGVLCAIHIGSWDLKYADAFQLRQQAQECLDLLPEWREKAKTGSYTNHEIGVLVSHRVNPMQPFREGLPQPNQNQSLEAKYYIEANKQAETEERARLEALPKPEDPEAAKKGRELLNEVMSGLFSSVTPDYRKNMIPCECCGTPFEEILTICPSPSCGIERSGEKR